MPKSPKINFDPNSWQKIQVGTLLHLLNDSAYNLTISRRINKNDPADLNKLIKQYLPPERRPAKLVKALGGAATAAKIYCDIKTKGIKDPKGLKQAETDYAKHTDVILEYLKKEFFSIFFSIVW